MNRREQVLDAALRLFRRYGFRKTTVDEIAAEAGVGKGSVYLEFLSKEDLFFALVEEHERAILAEVRLVADSRRKLPKRLTEVALVRPFRNFDELQQLPEAFEMLASLRGRLAERIRPYYVQCEQLVAELIREGCVSGCFRVANPAAAARVFYSAFEVAFVFTMQGMERATLEKTLRSLAGLLMTGLSGEGQ